MRSRCFVFEPCSQPRGVTAILVTPIALVPHGAIRRYTYWDFRVSDAEPSTETRGRLQSKRLVAITLYAHAEGSPKWPDYLRGAKELI
jgi:hypothetical protein